MLVIPCSNRVIVEEIETKEDETAFLVPEEFSSEEKFKLYKFVHAGSQCRNEYETGDELLIESYLVEEAKIAGKKVLIAGESGVVCIIRHERG